MLALVLILAYHYQCGVETVKPAKKHEQIAHGFHSSGISAPITTLLLTIELHCNRCKLHPLRGAVVVVLKAGIQMDSCTVLSTIC